MGCLGLVRSASVEIAIRSEPQGTPNLSEPQSTPNLSEPQGTPNLSEHQGTPNMSEPQGNPPPSEPQGTPNAHPPDKPPQAPPAAPHAARAPPNFPAPPAAYVLRRRASSPTERFVCGPSSRPHRPISPSPPAPVGVGSTFLAHPDIGVRRRSPSFPAATSSSAIRMASGYGTCVLLVSLMMSTMPVLVMWCLLDLHLQLVPFARRLVHTPPRAHRQLYAGPLGTPRRIASLAQAITI